MARALLIVLLRGCVAALTEFLGLVQSMTGVLRACGLAIIAFRGARWRMYEPLNPTAKVALQAAAAREKYWSVYWRWWFSMSDKERQRHHAYEINAKRGLGKLA